MTAGAHKAADKAGARRPRAGRPSRVTPEQIAKAALKVGLNQATIKNVAEALNMSVPGLYHHVRTRDELIALATRHAFTGLPTASAENIGLEAFLLDWARDMYDRTVKQPGLLQQTASGNSIGPGVADHVDWLLERLEGYGVDLDEGYAIFCALLAALLGAATLKAGDEAMAKRGASVFRSLDNAAQTPGNRALDRVKALAADPARQHPDRFDTIRLMVRALVAERQG